MIKVRFKKDLKRLDNIEREAQERTQKGVMAAAEALVADIRNNWSHESPSIPGNAPAIKTGNLDTSFSVEQGRDELGRFASSAVVKIDTENGSDPQNRGQYAAELEDSMNRPFVRPAIERASATLPHHIKREWD
jgi:hypothetical protein